MRAARVRRKRILSEQRRLLQGGVDVDALPPLFSRPVPLSDDDMPDYLTKNENENGQSCVSDRGINNRPPPSAIVMTCGDNNSSSFRGVDHVTDRNANHNNFAWQARKVRMARLRMINGNENPPTEAPAATVAIMATDSKHISNRLPVGSIVRADDDNILACDGDESSI